MSLNDEKYALKWDKYTDHIKHGLDMILEANDFVDVTLSCEGMKIKAHRIILSACSTYFYDILKDNPGTHPTIVLRDMKYNDIKYLLKFMYCGEVQVPTENFSSFLNTASFLQVSGLIEDETNDDKPETKELKNEVMSHEKPKPLSAMKPHTVNAVSKKRTSPTSTSTTPHKKRKDSEKSEENEHLSGSGSDSKEDDEVCSSKSVSMENITNIQKLLSETSYLNKDTNPECECPVCAEKFNSIYLLKQHVAYHLGETKCQICAKVFYRLDSLRKHMNYAHKINLNTMKKER